MNVNSLPLTVTLPPGASGCRMYRDMGRELVYVGPGEDPTPGWRYVRNHQGAFVWRRVRSKRRRRTRAQQTRRGMHRAERARRSGTGEA